MHTQGTAGAYLETMLANADRINGALGATSAAVRFAEIIRFKLFGNESVRFQRVFAQVLCL